MTTMVGERLGRIGLWVSGAGPAGPAGAGDFARRVEALGARAVWVGGGNPDERALGERGEMLAATKHLVVATGIVNIWAWDPAALYTQAAALERGYPGRFLLGLGVSHRPLVEQIGRDYEHPLEAMKAFLDGLDRAAQASGDDSVVPTRVLAALGPKMLRLARDRSAGAHPYLVTPEHTAMARRELGAGPLLAPEQAVVVTPGGAGGGGAGAGAGVGASGPGPADPGAGAAVPGAGAVGSAPRSPSRRRLRSISTPAPDHVCIQPLGEGRTVDLDGFKALLGALGSG